MSFTLNEELASINDIGGKPASVSAPREHPFLLQSVGGQTLTVFTETSVGKLELNLLWLQYFCFQQTQCCKRQKTWKSDFGCFVVFCVDNTVVMLLYLSDYLVWSSNWFKFSGVIMYISTESAGEGRGNVQCNTECSTLSTFSCSVLTEKTCFCVPMYFLYELVFVFFSLNWCLLWK